MTDRPGATRTPTVDSPPPLDPSGFGTTWIVVAAGVIGVLTVLLLGTTVAVTKSGPPEEKKAASAPAESPTPTPAKKSTAAEGSTNIKCDGSFIVELARSTTPSTDSDVEKAAAKEDNGKFLDANASCERYTSEGVRRVAYVGPFETLAAACKARVKTGDVGAVLHQMEADKVGPSFCICKAPLTPPVLNSGSGTNGNVTTLLAIGDLQRMLKELGFFKPKIDGDPYGPKTVTAVQAFQSDQKLFASGSMTQATWAALRRSKDKSGNALC
ncbi:MAG: peptidoglycan-binding domain-containing protein [Aeromicrobium sp.]